ncbi:hypothetical protein L861_18155 [Litchfieldella anticariensis FP35 = DSM 16096]|uniref:Uncharacterized protein n=1 Tax=Litchfieldella anticariensis (strain DSM 16096 / CECT 5854 / CIP 108499 / LMG 22089 / FP35) TaxID=1121939 RepID=S2KMX3_LITA3|nr:thioesterase family protein [Halomonas anticariensis]EPC03462.1 hypothetical protein L861_18155 [Halomonas anticariensis FP35 = DSM 16096]
MDTRITRTTLRVRGYHLDVYAHVNNARYLEFLEEGRWSYFDEKVDMTSLFDDDVALAVVNLNINYRRGAVMHDDLEVLTSLCELGHRSAVMRQVINRVRDGKCIADADLTFVLLDARNNKAIPFEGNLREALEPLVLPRDA